MGDWLTILIILLILGILLDGWRRMRNAQRDSLKVSRSMRRSSATGTREERDDYNSAELPNGGARVVAYRETPEDERPFEGRPPADELDVDDTEQDGEWLDEAYDPDPDEDAPTEAEPAAPRETRRSSIPQQVTLNLDESVPILMETEENESDDGRIEPTFAGGPTDEPEPERAPPAPRAAQRTAPKAESRPAPERQKPAARASAPKPSAPKASSARPSAPKPEPKPAPPPEEVLIINVMAPSGQLFRGDALLESLLEAGLRYGDMNIFHRYEDPKGGGSILFSLANMVKPGTFDLDAMDDFTTPGVSLFMTLPLESVELENVEVFDEMLEAARSIAYALGGEMKDENRSVLTRQTQEHCRQRIHEFERKQLSRGY